jgi:aminoglycoside phosphotransferase (APT) family kinase protein
MLSEQRVNTLRPGDVFRDWLIGVLGDKIRNKRCDVAVYRISPASHTVCRYEFIGENYSVVAKFYAEPTGAMKSYDPVRSMERELKMLKRAQQIISTPRHVAARKDFHCVLVTEYVQGRPLCRFMNTENGLYDKLTALAHTLRKLHDHTRSQYRKQDEFAHFHKVLDQLKLDPPIRLRYNRLLGDWWYSTLIDQSHGCMIHNDANPVNYVFDHDKVYVLDFESSWEHANFVHDLGIVAAELKHFFAWQKGNDQRAEPYIGHFLWHYSRDEAEFHRITQALPFFMSQGLLRMARLGIDPDRSAYIFREALACLMVKH